MLSSSRIAPILALGVLWSPPAAAQVPYFQNFDAFSTCSVSCRASCLLSQGWTNLTTDTMDWTVDIAGTTSGNTGPSGDHTTGTGRYLYTEASSGCSNDRAEMSSPVINLAGTNNPVLQFWYHMYGTSMGTLHVDVIRDPAGAAVRTNDIIPALTDNRNLWQQVTCVSLDRTAPVQVIFRGLTGSSFGSDMAIDDVQIIDLPGVDVALTEFSLSTGCAGESGVVGVTLDNLGGSVTSVPVTVSVNGSVVITETLSVNMPACSDPQTLNLATPLTLPAGPASVTVQLGVPGDANPANDSQTRALTIQPVVSTFPYAQGFESAGHGWVAGGAQSSWARGLPADTVISSAFNGSNAYVTNLTADYNVSEASFIEGPCFDFTSLTNPRFEARVFWESEVNRDGAQLQVSRDGGATWQIVGTSFDPGWYSSSSVTALQSAFGSGYGWSGRTNTANGSGAWTLVGHDLQNMTAGSSPVRLRVAFASGTSIQDEGFAIDDVRISDNLPRIEVRDGATTSPAGAVRPGDVLMLTQRLQLEAVLGPNSVSSITITRQGSLPDSAVTQVTIWRDNGDGQFSSAADTNLGTGVFVGGRAPVSFANPLMLAQGQTRLLFVTLDLAISAAAGGTVGTSLDAASDVGGALRVELPDGALVSPLQVVVIAEPLLPFTDAFDGALAPSRALVTRGSHPVVSGTAVSVAPDLGNPGQVVLAQAAGGESANSPPNMAVLGFASGPAVAALDYYFDLSGLSPATDDVFFEFMYDNIGQTEDAADHVFLSDDGGSTWFAQIFDFDFSPPVTPGWNLATGDLSAAFSAAGRAFTSEVVVRVQVQGGGAQGDLLIDDVWAGFPEQVAVQRAMGPPIFSGGVDDLGSIPGGAPTQVTYDIVNLGQRDLDLVPSFQVSNVVNVNGIGLSTNAPTVLAPGQRGSFTVSFAPIGGTFSFDLTFAASDPRLPAGRFTFTASGLGVVEPRLALRDEAGAAVLDGARLEVGPVVVGQAPRQRYVVASVGTGSVQLADTPPVSVENAVNANVTLRSQPAALILPGRNETFDLSFGPPARGAFSFDLVLRSNDVDDGELRWTVAGEGTSPEIDVSRAGMSLAVGDTDDVGRLDVGGRTSFVYRIDNPGNADLRLTDLPYVRLIANANVRTEVPALAANFVPAEGFVDVEVFMEPIGDGPLSATLLILTDDVDEGEYRVEVIGTGYTPVPDITVSRMADRIPNGGTDAYAPSAPGEDRTVTYVIGNEGERDLVMTSPVVVDERMNVEVEVSAVPTASVAPGATSEFGLTYRPSREGPFSFRVIVWSNDPDEAAFEFMVQGEARVSVPDIVLEQPAGTVRANGATARLGDLEIGVPSTIEVTVRNQGTGTLTLPDDAVGVSEELNTTVTVVSSPPPSVAVGASGTFAVELTVGELGPFSAAVTVTSDDPDDPTYVLRVAGVGIPKRTLPSGEGGCTCVARIPGVRGGGWAMLGLGLLLFVRRRR